tara:strand:+ start:8340 stop:9503 length:1164 start_codon:yes stop_codon:yes gene_type:complete
MSAHAKLSPSSSPRWTICTASPEACKDIPDESSEAADEGTFFHDIAARALKPLSKGEGPAKPAMSFLGRKSECGRFIVDEDAANHIQEYLDAVEFAFDLYGGTLEIEIQVKLTDEIWGTVDALILSADGKTIIVIDLKMGAGVYVSELHNTQLQIYAGGALKTYHESLKSVETVVTAIVQPRHHQGEAWREQSYHINELFTALAAIESAAVATKVAPKFVVGEHCTKTFCPKRSECQARRNASLEACREAFSEEKPTIEAMTDERIAEILLQADDVKKWLNDLEAHATKRATMGVEFPGLKLVEKVGIRKFNDDAEATHQLEMTYNIDPVTEPKPVSPAEAERRLQATGLSKKQAQAVVRPLTHKPSKGPVLVPVSDRRSTFKPATF